MRNNTSRGLWPRSTKVNTKNYTTRHDSLMYLDRNSIGMHKSFEIMMANQTEREPHKF